MADILAGESAVCRRKTVCTCLGTSCNLQVELEGSTTALCRLLQDRLLIVQKCVKTGRSILFHSITRNVRHLHAE